MVYGAAAIMDEVEFAAKYLNAGLTYLQSYLERKRVSGETEGSLYDNVAKTTCLDGGGSLPEDQRR